jgi:hypothetical protein
LYFLEEALRPAGVQGVVKISHDYIPWNKGIVFFDLETSPDDWPDLVVHFLERGSIVILVSESFPVVWQGRTKGEGSIQGVLLLTRTWEATVVRDIFYQAASKLSGLPPPAAPDDPTAEHVHAH